MITIKQEVFRQLAAVLHQGLSSPAVAVAGISENNKVRVVQDGQLVEEFSTPEEFCAALFRSEQVAIPAEVDCERMAKNAGLKKPGNVVKHDRWKKGNV